MSAGRTLRVALGGLLIANGSSAFAQSSTTQLDLEVGADYSTNPFVVVGGDEESASARVSATAAHSWSTARSVFALSGFVENSTYLRRYGSNQIFEANAQADHRASARLRLFGRVSFSADKGGQLLSRRTAIPTQPGPPDPVLPDPGVILDPSVLTETGRLYRMLGQIGGSLELSARDSLTLYGGAEQFDFRGRIRSRDYRVYSGALAYDRTLSARATIGARVQARFGDYENGETTRIINPQLTATLRLSEVWEISGDVGVSLIRQRFIGRRSSSTGLSFAASICREKRYDRICARASRQAQNSGVGDILTANSFDADYRHKFDERQDLQLSAGITHYSDLGRIAERVSDYYFVRGTYSNKLNRRLSAGATAAWRKFDEAASANKRTDARFSFFLRYRLGDIQ